MADDFGLRTYAFVLAVHDLKAAAAYFRDVLGFTEEWRDGDSWRALGRGGVHMMMGACPDALPVASLGDHSYFAYLHVDDVDALHAEWSARGAIILRAPADRPWGMREMAVATPEGHRLMVGQRRSA